MSPTDAMLTRNSDLSGSGGGGGGGGGAGPTGSGSGGASITGSGGVAQAASSDSARRKRTLRALVVTDADTEYIDLRGAQATAHHVQLIEVVNRADVHAVVIALVDLDALYMRLDTV